MFAMVYSMFLVVWEIVCCKYLLQSFVPKRKYREKIVVWAVNLGLFGIYYLVAFVLRGHLWLKQIAVVLVMSAAMYCFFECNYLKIMILTLMYQGLVLLADYLTMLVMGKAVQGISHILLEDPAASALISFIGRVVLLLLLLVPKRSIRHQSGEMLTDLVWLRLLLISVITIISLTAIILQYNVMQNLKQSAVLLYVALGMAGMNLMVFYLVNDILEREMIIQKERLFRERAKNEINLYYSISENLEKQRRRTHEFKNQIAYIFSLIKSDSYQELKEYVVKLDSELKLSMDMVDTNNVLVNAILNIKYREALDKKIVFVLKVNDLSNIILDDTALVVILSNLLDNAMEACADCVNKVIKCKFVLEDDQIIISVKNNFSEPPRRHGEKFVSTKEHTQEHGFGIENVVEAVQRYHGKHVIDFDDESFTFSILIPNRVAV